jgi:hypothetical protein
MLNYNMYNFALQSSVQGLCWGILSPDCPLGVHSQANEMHVHDN